MKLFVTAVDEPIYLVPYIRSVIETCGASVVGVAELRPQPRRLRLTRIIALVLLSMVVFSPRQLLRLMALRMREAAAAIGLGTTRHRLADVCRELAIPFQRIESANAPSFAAALSAQGVDVLLNQTGELLREPLLSAPRVGVINRHLSLLPAYRGAWPIFWQFANGDRRVGVTIHLVDSGLDTGEIVAQVAVDRAPGATMADTIADLFDKSVALTCDALTRLENGSPRITNAGANASIYRTPGPGEVLRYLFGRPARRG